MGKASFKTSVGLWAALAALLIAIAIVGSIAGKGATAPLALIVDGAALLAGAALLQAMVPPRIVRSQWRVAAEIVPAIAAIAAEAALTLSSFGRPQLLVGAVEGLYLALAATQLWRSARKRAWGENAVRFRAMLLIGALAQMLIGGRMMWFAILFASAGLLVLLLPPVLAGSAAKYRKSGASAAGLAEIRDTLVRAARDRALFRNPGLALSDLASSAGVSASRASEALSQAGRTSFPELIADLRAEEAARLLALPENAGVAVEPIGMEAGFRSRSNFYTAFKRKYGLTPAEYRSSVLE